MSSTFLIKPTPATEAAEFLKGKPAVTRAVFDKLLPELRARAFLVTGIEGANVLQGLRDRIADLPQGGDWDEIKKDLVNDMSPFFGDPDDPGTEAAASARATLLLRHHGLQSYRAARYEIMERHRDVFPYRMYIATGDAQTRPSHAALHGLILPADDPFWDTHMPPWEWNCRCDVASLTREQVEEVAAQEEADEVPADERRVVMGERQKELSGGRLHRGGQTYDVRPPVNRGASGPATGRTLVISVAELEAKYDKKTFADFRAWAKKQKLADGRTVWEWVAAA